MQLDNLSKNLDSIEEQLKKIDFLVGELILGSEDNSLVKNDFILDEIRDAKNKSNNLKKIFHKDSLENKLIAASVIVEKIYALITSECKKLNISISIATISNGNIPLSTAKDILPIVFNVLKIQFKRIHLNETLINKDNESNRLSGRAISIDIENTGSGTSIRIVDDCDNSVCGAYLFKEEIYSVREQIGKILGTCKLIFFEGYGFSFQLKIPNNKRKSTAYIVDCGRLKVAIPKLSAVANFNNLTSDHFYYSDDGVPYFHHNDIECPVCEVDPEIGLCPADEEYIKQNLNDKLLLVIGTADLQIAIFLNSVLEEFEVVTHKSDTWLNPSCWHSMLATHNESTKICITPLLNAQTIIDFNRNFQVNV